MSILAEEMPKAGEQYRFVVGSADEAVRILRERLGDSARVVSVRQVEGAGLGRFLRAPKLEVIAEVLAASRAETSAEMKSCLPEGEFDLAPAAPVAAPRPFKFEQEQSSNLPAPVLDENLERLLSRCGLPPVTLASLKSTPHWSRIAELPLHLALNEITLFLRSEYQGRPARPLGQRVAFMGAAGAGKTTALCKWLATDVFVRQSHAAVLKVDFDRANPGDGLAVFCEALGVVCSRSVDDLPAHLLPNERTYADLPGVGLADEEEIATHAEMLSNLSIRSRVLVINAAYETNVIKRLYELGERLAATHVVFTHLDELPHWGKLWEFVLGRDLTPLFLSSGQSIAGDFVEEVFPSILARTFSAAGSPLAKSKAGL
jgi:flagellar biosynthesis protein FlhF